MRGQSMGGRHNGAMRNGEQSASLNARKQISAFGIVFRPLLFMIYLVRRSMNRSSMTGNTCDRSRPVGALCNAHRDCKFALLNRARLRSSFDRTVLRELWAANLISGVSFVASFVRIAIHLFSMLFFSFRTILLFIIVIVRFNERLQILIGAHFSVDISFPINSAWLSFQLPFKFDLRLQQKR